MVRGRFNFRFIFLGYGHLPVKHLFLDYRQSPFPIALLPAAIIGAIASHVPGAPADKARTGVSKAFVFFWGHVLELFGWSLGSCWSWGLSPPGTWGGWDAGARAAGVFTDDKFIGALGS